MTREEAKSIKEAFYEWLESNFSTLEIETILDNVVLRSVRLDEETGNPKILLGYVIETKGEQFLRDEENDYFYYNEEIIPIEYKRMEEPISSY